MRERIRTLVDYLGISMRAFSLSIGASAAWARNINEGIGSKMIDKILSTYPMVSKDWLLDGRGEMILENGVQNLKEKTPSYYFNNNYKQMYEELRQDNKELREENKGLRQAMLELMHKNESLIVENTKLRAKIEVRKEVEKIVTDS